MTYEERSAWAYVVLSVLTYAVYAAWIIARWDGGPLVDVDYVAPMLWTIGGSIVVSIVVHIFLGNNEKDVRDKEIGRYGEYVGQSFVVIGGVAALLMAMAEWEYFWIANVLFACFVLSGLLASITKVVMYRKGMPSW